MAERLRSDILVLGGGMAGHTAAARAARLGARVILLEKAPDFGGNAVLSGTSLWTAPTLEVLRERAPAGDFQLARRIVDGYDDAIAWVASTGVELGAPRHVLGYGRGFRFDVVSYFKRCRQIVTDNGGWALTGVATDRLLLDGGGRVSGAVVSSADGEFEIEAGAVILATGGFQASAELRRRYFGPNADRVLVRANPYSTGDGMRLAEQAGGALAGDMRTFYGHLMGAPIPSFAREHYTRLSVWYSEDAVLVDLHGERFCDESLGDHHNAQEVVWRPSARAVLILDEFVVHTVKLNENSVLLSLEEMRRSGVHLATASTLEALGEAIAAWGFDGAAMVRTVRGFNEHLMSGGKIAVPRRWRRYPLRDAPFHALEVQPAVTFTQGGVRVDPEARVLRASGDPVAGLFAAGADIGGVYEGGYAGGLALACVYGGIAARNAVMLVASGAAPVA